jgi:hypothetical protein
MEAMAEFGASPIHSCPLVFIRGWKNPYQRDAWFRVRPTGLTCFGGVTTLGP